MLAADWFPNSAGHFAFLTTSPYAGVSAQDWKVDFSGGYVYSTDRDVAAALRLVRGSQ